MSLNIEKVHVLERDATGRDVLVKSFPYSRFVSSDGGAVSVQGGRFYSDGSNQPVIPFNKVPNWVWKSVKAMTPEGRAKVGLPENMNDIKERKAPSEDSETSSKDVQPLNGKEEPIRTLVDYVYELDHANDDHWTKGGLPNIKALKRAGGNYFTRGEIESAAPGYTRKES